MYVRYLRKKFTFTVSSPDKFLSKFFHRQIPKEILYTYVIKILHLALIMFPQLANYNRCRFEWHIACETPEFILQDMRPP